MTTTADSAATETRPAVAVRPTTASSSSASRDNSEAKQQIENSTVPLREVIRRRRESLELSQTEMAKALGIASPEFISMVESGRRRFALNNIAAVADVLRLNRKDLCRLALFEEAPNMAMSLYGTDPKGYTEPAEAKGKVTARYDPNQIAYHNKLWSLPQPFRANVLANIDQLSELINTKTPLPRMAE